MTPTDRQKLLEARAVIDRLLEMGDSPVEPLPTPSKYMTSKDFADHVKVSSRTVATWIHNGLPVLKIGKSLRIEVAVAEEWLRSHNAA
jgi:hypothetical protein